MATQDEQQTAARQPDWEPSAHEVGGPVGGGARGEARQEEHARLREQCPVAWADEWGGHWTLSRFEDVRAAATKHQVFRSGQLFAQIPQPAPVIPISLNPPEHAIYRRALNKYFTLQRMAVLEPTVRRHVDHHLTSILEWGGGEMVAELCAPVSARGLASLLNLPDDAWRQFVGETAAIDDALRNEADDVGDLSYALLAGHVGRLVAERRAHPLDPDEDLISGILAMTVDGEPLDDGTVTGIGVMLFGAGHGTTRDGMATALHRLATEPGDQARLRADPSLIPSAIEEFLRLDPPVGESGRRAGADTELHGRVIEKGEFVSLSLTAANRDEREFPEPGACVIDRSPNRHLAFGHGVHKCLGMQLGRLEIRVALEEILARTRSFALDGEAEPNTMIFLGGFASLPLRLDLR